MVTKSSSAISRLFYLDYLRVFSSIAVILLHVASQNMKYVALAGTEWHIYNCYNGFVRWAVPVFVMISGSLFLSKEISIKKLYSKNILRLVIAYIGWSVFYALVTPAIDFIADTGNTTSVAEIFENMITGAVHMWFIPMIIGIYMCIPFIKPLTNNKSTIKYFLILAFVFLFLKTQINNISNDFFSGTLACVTESINYSINNMGMNMVLGFTSYFILGYVLNEAEISSKKRTVIYILGILGFLTTVILNAIFSIKANESLETYYTFSTLNVAFMSVAIFVWFKYNIKGNDFFNKIIISLSKYSFGAYMVHIFILIILTSMGIQSTTFHPILSVPVISVITAVLSYLISFILNKIPFIKKYFV